MNETKKGQLKNSYVKLQEGWSFDACPVRKLLNYQSVKQFPMTYHNKFSVNHC